ncbi:hypothetical protein GLE_0530 [Lysobacter enzymogenes]|uniref:Uncharacterized protein n=1 Tax=Lysobacter enzymogenes TaxID=69 RepID=A0A0S2DBI8_LYSEN|nr:hypothetical protein GLE_0530 [Lysobacter enzymogenes]
MLGHRSGPRRKRAMRRTRRCDGLRGDARGRVRRCGWSARVFPGVRRY